MHVKGIEGSLLQGSGGKAGLKHPLLPAAVKA